MVCACDANPRSFLSHSFGLTEMVPRHSITFRVSMLVAGLNDVAVGDVARDDVTMHDATSDIADGEPPQWLNAEDAGAMPYVPDASM